MIAEGAVQMIVHADDLGLAGDVNHATIDALDRGSVTSASLMVPAPAFRQASAAIRSRAWDIGIHLTLTSEWVACRWRPVAAPSAVATLVAPDGCLWPTTRDFASRAAPEEVEVELRAQIDRACDAGIAPTHLDSHMFALLSTAPLRAVFARVAADYSLPHFDPLPRACAPAAGSWDRPHLAMVSGVTGGSPKAWEREYAKLVSRLLPGVTQLIVHCGYDTAALRRVTGIGLFDARCRELDYRIVTSDRFRAALDARGVTRVGWRDSRGGLHASQP